MMRKIFYIVLIFTFFDAHCQSNFLFGNGANASVDIGRSYVGTYLKREFSASTINKVIGSPYLFDSWKNYAIIITENNKKYKIVDLNYNASSDMFAAKTSKDSVFIFKPTYLKEVIINNRIFKKKLDKESGLFNYYEIIAASKEGEILKQNLKTIRTGITNHLTMQREPDYYMLKERYYYLDFANGNIKELPLKKKSIFKIFGKKSNKVKEYITINKLSVKDEKDLGIIFKFYDSL